jgi:phosphate starvation-inducible PhoH-like protein
VLVGGKVQTVIRLGDGEDERALHGLGSRPLRRLGERLGVKVTVRGASVIVHGEAGAARTARRVIGDLVARARRGDPVGERTVDEALAGEAVGPAPGGAAAPAPGPGGNRIVRALDDSFVAPRTPGQKEYVDAIASHDIVFALGPAGTGKTYLAVACAVAALRTGAFRRLVLTRPAVEAGEHLGFLPGDLRAKVNPYLRPLYDALEDLIDFDEVQRSLARDVIEVAPLAYMRGRTLDRSFIILDEAQNTTPEQMKMFLTRMGRSSKVVVTGDSTQVDLPRGARSGLLHSREILKGVAGIAFVTLGRPDIVRHPLVQEIVEAYEAAETTLGGAEGRRTAREP